MRQASLRAALRSTAAGSVPKLHQAVVDMQKQPTHHRERAGAAALGVRGAQHSQQEPGKSSLQLQLGAGALGRAGLWGGHGM